MEFHKCMALTLVTLGLMSFQASAQAQRVAIVNAARVLKESNVAIESKQRAESTFSSREKALIAQESSLKMLTEKFDAEVLTLSDVQRIQRRSQLAAQAREFHKKRSAFSEDKNAAFRMDAQKMIALAKKIVKQVAEAEKFDIVVQDAVYVSPEFDITDMVIAGMNSETHQ